MVVYIDSILIIIKVLGFIIARHKSWSKITKRDADCTWPKFPAPEHWVSWDWGAVRLLFLINSPATFFGQKTSYKLLSLSKWQQVSSKLGIHNDWTPALVILQGKLNHSFQPSSSSRMGLAKDMLIMLACTCTDFSDWIVPCPPSSPSRGGAAPLILCIYIYH